MNKRLYTFYKNNSLLIKKLIVLLGWVLMISIVVIYNHTKFTLTNTFPICNFLRVTGCYCPGCGGTRAMEQLLKGNVIGSIRLNFMPFLFGSIFLFVAIQYSLNLFLKTKIYLIKFRQWMLWISAAIVIGFWIVRNII